MKKPDFGKNVKNSQTEGRPIGLHYCLGVFHFFTSLNLIYLCLLHKFSKWHLWAIFLTIPATLHYINLAFIPRDCDIAPNKNPTSAPQTKKSFLLSPQNPRTANAVVLFSVRERNKRFPDCTGFFAWSRRPRILVRRSFFEVLYLIVFQCCCYIETICSFARNSASRLSVKFLPHSAHPIFLTSVRKWQRDCAE